MSKVAQTRARTAMRRLDLSVPAQHLVGLGIFKPSHSYFDFGCGRGDDVEALSDLGYKAKGWDPVHFPSTRKTKSDFVGCFFVINVIENESERPDVLRAAWGLTKQVLLIAARLEHEQDEAHVVPRGDGWMTTRGTFQRFYGHQELGDVISNALGTPVDAVAPGVYAVFRHEQLRQEWKAQRMRLPSSPRLKTKSSKQLEEHRILLEPIMNFALERGRLPMGEELEEFSDAVDVFGSAKMAFHVVVQATDRDAWKKSAIERSIDLLAFLALAQFDEVDRMSKLPESIQKDVRAHFGSFKAANEKSSQLLFSSGNRQAVDLACRASSVGKLTPTALYVHRSALNEIPALLKVVLGCGQRLIGDITEANVIKIFRNEPMISFLEYPEFDTNPHPWLDRGWHLNLHEQKLRTMRFGNRENRPILHRLHEFVALTHPQYQAWKTLTEEEVAKGWYATPSMIGTEDGWSSVVSSRDI